MPTIALVFVLTLVAATLFYGGRAARRSKRGRGALNAAVDDHPTLLLIFAGLAIVALVALGLAAIYGVLGPTIAAPPTATG